MTDEAYDLPAVDERDRVLVHLIWDGVLLAAAVAAGVLVWTRSSSALSGDALRSQLVAASASVLLATAFAVSLRAAVPNLAIGSIAGATGLFVGYLATQHHQTVGASAGFAAAAGAVVGLLLGLVVVALRVPAWAASLAAVSLLSAAGVAMGNHGVGVVRGGPDLLRWPWPLFLGAALISAIGGAVALAPRPRAALGAYRPSGDPAARRGPRGGGVAIAALVLSSALASAAGLVAVFRLQSAVPGDVGIGTTTLAAVGAALLGGVSVHGRRGGVLGTVLAVITMQLLLLWFALRNYPTWTPLAVFGAAILLGLVISRIVEALGSPRSAPSDDLGPPPWSDSGYETAYQPPYQPAQSADRERL